MAKNEPDGGILVPSEQRLHRLDVKFAASISSLHEQLEALLRCPHFTFRERPRRLPDAAVYLFTENSRPLYVGRSNHFRQRLGNHCHLGSQANQSVFAFKLAREEAGFAEAAYSGPNTRKGLMGIPAFVEGFKRAKHRLNAMQIRFVEEGDQIKQTLLEIYCAIALATPYNDFSTH